MKYALSAAGRAGPRRARREASLDFGYYYSRRVLCRVGCRDAGGGRLFASWQEFDEWRRANGKVVDGAPRVAVGFYKSTYYTSDTATLDAVIAEIEKSGANAIPVFGYPGGVTFERLLLDENGAARADVGLGFLFRFTGPEAADSLGKLDIPVVNLVTLYGRSEREWRESKTGLSMFEGTFQVAVPELGGLVAPTVVGSREKVLDLETGLSS